MTQTIDAGTAVEKVTRAKHDPDVRIIRRMEIGSVIQQGDLYVHRLPEKHARGKQIAAGKAQVALGDNMGARHVAEGEIAVFASTTLPAGVKAPMDVSASEICGPVVVARDTWSLTHPEHAHFTLPAGVYGVTYQYDPRTMRRVQD